jgi:hypothetical protein
MAKMKTLGGAKSAALVTTIVVFAAPIAGVASDVTMEERTAAQQNRERTRSTEDGGMAHHRMDGMMEMHGMMRDGCCGQMGRADVSVEKTASGAVVRFEAPRGEVERAQRMAEMMGHCMGADRNADNSSGK